MFIGDYSFELQVLGKNFDKNLQVLGENYDNNLQVLAFFKTHPSYFLPLLLKRLIIIRILLSSKSSEEKRNCLNMKIC